LKAVENLPQLVEVIREICEKNRTYARQNHRTLSSTNTTEREGRVQFNFIIKHFLWNMYMYGLNGRKWADGTIAPID
jgi:hypothetical protein